MRLNESPCTAPPRNPATRTSVPGEAYRFRLVGRNAAPARRATTNPNGAQAGALGGFVTGSGTSANVLFGSLQTGAANALGVSANLLAAANVMGAGIGKMICPQSIAIGTAAALIAPRAGEAFKRAFPWFLAVLALACLVCGLLAL